MNNKNIINNLQKDNKEKERFITSHILLLIEDIYKKVKNKIPRDIRKDHFLSMFINFHLNNKTTEVVIKDYYKGNAKDYYKKDDESLSEYLKIKYQEKKGWLSFKK